MVVEALSWRHCAGAGAMVFGGRGVWFDWRGEQSAAEQRV